MYYKQFRYWLRLSILFVWLFSFLFSSTSLDLSNPFSVSSASAAAISPWLDAQQSGEIIYLLYSTPPSIKRYQISAQSWLSDISLSGTPTAFRVTSDVLYVAFGRRAAKLNLDGTDEIHLLNTSSNIVSLHIADPIMIVNCSSGLYANLISFNLSSFTVVDSKSYYPHSMFGTSLAPSIRKVFGRDSGLSPADINEVTFSPDGMITGQSDGPYHGDYPSASKTWVSPDDNLVIDNSGIVYSTIDLTYINSLQGAFDDLTFYGNLPIVLRGGTIIAYSNVYLETGRTTPVNTPLNIFVYGEIIYGFYGNTQGPQVIEVPISSLNPLTPGAIVDPNGLLYTPDKVELGNDETVYLLSKQFQSVFRWSVAQRRYLSTIPLLNAPYTIAYSADENILYTVYPNGGIYKIELADGTTEEPFANLPTSPCGLATAGSFVFTCDSSGAWVSHTVFAPTGERISTVDWNYFSREYIWNAARQKMYFFRDDTSPNDILWEDIDSAGVIGAKKDSPYHGGYSFIHPIRVKPDGSIVLIGSGHIFDGLSLAQVNTLSNAISDAGWKGDDLVTLRSLNGNSELQKWASGNYGIVKSQAVNGGPISLLPVNEGWLVITSLANKPRFTLWSSDLSLLAEAAIANFSADPLTGNIPLEVHFTNLSSEGLYDASLWDFGDGETSADQNPVHIYTQSGTYTVKLTVTGQGGTDTMIQTQVVQVLPVTANFSASTTSGQVPLTVQFTNQTSGQYTSVLWDFGDGTTGTEDNPSHTYQDSGIYTVSLKVDGPYGSSMAIKENYIQSTLFSTYFLPLISHGLSEPLLNPGTYYFEHLCQQYPLYLYGTYMGQMRECVPSVEIVNDGSMYFQFSWTLYKSSTTSQCVIKYSDVGNRNMYIKDSAGNRYDHIQVGGTQYIDCMNNGVVYTGWFKFPSVQTRNTIFTFYDDDAGIRISPIILPAAP